MQQTATLDLTLDLDDQETMEQTFELSNDSQLSDSTLNPNSQGEKNWIKFRIARVIARRSASISFRSTTKPWLCRVLLYVSGYCHVKVARDSTGLQPLTHQFILITDR